MKYRILLLITLLCAIPAAAVGGTLASYSYETACSFNIEADLTGAALQMTAAEAEDTGELTQEGELPAYSRPPEEAPADMETPETAEAPKTAKTPETPQEPGTAKTPDTPQEPETANAPETAETPGDRPTEESSQEPKHAPDEEQSRRHHSSPDASDK